MQPNLPIPNFSTNNSYGVNYDLTTTFNNFIINLHQGEHSKYTTELVHQLTYPMFSLSSIFAKIANNSYGSYVNELPSLFIPASMKLKIESFNVLKKYPDKDNYCGNIYNYFFNLCFNSGNEMLFRYLLDAHSILNYPKMVISFGNNITTEMNIISLALIFKKESWLDKVNYHLVLLEKEKSVSLQFGQPGVVFSERTSNLNYFDLINNEIKKNIQKLHRKLKFFW